MEQKKRKRNPWLYGFLVSLVIGVLVIVPNILVSDTFDAKKYFAMGTIVLVIGTLSFALLEIYSQRQKNKKQ